MEHKQFIIDAMLTTKPFSFILKGIGAASRDVVEPLKDADYILILQRKSKYGAGKFSNFRMAERLSAGNEGGAQVQDEATGYWLMTMTTQEPFAEIEYASFGFCF